MTMEEGMNASHAIFARSGMRAGLAHVAGFALALGLLVAGCDKEEVVDSVPPAAVTDLSAVVTDEQSVTLTWIAPGDDDLEGTAAAYDVRYAQNEFTAADWDSLTPVTGEPAPLAAGSSQSMALTGLPFAQLFYFALKTSDDAGNSSSMSNVAWARTPEPEGGWTVAADGSGHFATITEAIAFAADGDTIRIRPGRYSETLVLVQRALTFIGAGAESTTITYSAGSTETAVINVTGPSRVLFSGLQIMQEFIPCGAGIRCGVPAEVTFEDCAILWCGIETYSTLLSVRRCTVWGVAQMTCDMDVPLLKLYGSDVSFEQCIIGGAPHIVCSGMITCAFQCNDFWQCSFSSGSCPDPIGENGNTRSDPLLVDPSREASDFHLLPGSPCLEGGTPGCGRMGAFGEAQ
jgi:hypothetical protein